MNFSEDQQLETITPELAEAYLAKCASPKTQNRKIDRFADLMRQNQWHVTHQGLAFSSDGNLVDGRQRLQAVVRAEIAVQMLVTRNLDPDVRRVIDRGSPRSQGDMLHYAFGKAEGRRITPHARLLAKMALEKDTSGNLPLLNRVHDYFREGIGWILEQDIRPSGTLRGEMITALAFAYPTDREKVEEFYRVYVEGRSLPGLVPCPVNVLRNSMEAQAERRKPKTREDNFLKTLAALSAALDNQVIRASRPDNKAVGRFLKAYPRFENEQTGSVEP